MKQLLFTFLTVSILLSSATQTNAQCYSAIELDGVDDYMHTPLPFYNFNNFTIEMWINSADYSSNEMYVVINKGSLLGIAGAAPDGSFDVFADGLNPISVNSGSGTTPNASTWVHVAYVYNGSNRIVYLDGIPVFTSASTGSVNGGNTSDFGLVIGARFDGTQQYTNTSFEDVRVWGVARSEAQINANMSTNLTGSETGLYAYYRFEDGAGSSTVTDLTGNGNTLTLMNMDPATDWVPGLFSQPSQGDDVITNCGPFTWIDGNSYATDNNTATHTIVGGAVGGCDSIVTLDLTINAPVDTSVTMNAQDLTANDISTGVTYQWIDCGNGNTPISGETGQIFTATTTGTYAVIVTGLNGCRDTSNCHLVSFVGLEESNMASGITIAPNPVSIDFSIQSTNYSGIVDITITDLTGKVIQKLTNKHLATPEAVNIDMFHARSGTYFVNISDGTDSRIIRVVKK